MSQRWYYENHGNSVGPITILELADRIKKGEMTLIDLVFKEGEYKWLPAESFSEITDLIGNVTYHSTADWIILKSVNVDGQLTNEQIGPYNAEQILDLLDQGKIKFSDYVWRQGYEQWVPLGRVDQFEKPLKSSITVDMSLYVNPRFSGAPSKEAPLKKINPNLSSTPSIFEDLKPLEAKGEDLTLTTWKLNSQIVEKIKKNEIQLSSSAEAVDLAPPGPEIPKKKPKPRLEVDSISNPDPSKILQKIKNEASEVSPIKKNVKESPSDSMQTDFKRRSTDIESSQKPNSDTNSQRTQEFPTERDSREFKYHDSRQQWLRVVGAFCFIAMLTSIGFLFLTGRKKNLNKNADFSLKLEKPAAAVENTDKNIRLPKVNTIKSQSPSSAKGKTKVAKIKTPAVPTPPVTVTEESPEESPEELADKLAEKLDEKSEEGSQGVSEENIMEKSSVKVAENIPEKSAVPQKTDSDKSTKNDVPESTVKGNFKQKSYYHHKERMFLFYTSSEGQKLIQTLEKATKKHIGTPKNWKTFYGSWKVQTQKYALKVNKESKKTRLHRSLSLKLQQSARQLEDLGRNINSLSASGRVPLPTSELKSLEAQFNAVNLAAKNLDR